ncbi:uncharacterized protein LOC112564837 [Pomacea canaliculata]|nr:uncharacterized protein LOC112564837 [Pomacea canaliculata]
MVTLGVHNKRLPLEDVLARKIREEFVRTVDPSLLIPNLPHNLLTDVDEEMIQARQDTHGRTHAAWRMLNLLSRRGNWVTGLQQGLRSRQVRLEHLAQKIEDLLCEFAVLIGEVAMEVDFVEEEEDDMEVDHDSPLPPRTAGLTLDEPLLKELEGRHLSDLVDDQVQRFQKAVISAIAETFFTTVAKEPQHVTHLIELYKNIVNTICATSVTVGCLHVGLRMNYVSDVSTIRKLLEGGSLVQLLEHGLLTEERRRWLREQAAGYGLIWRRIGLRVAITEDNLNHCEAFLKWVNEPSLARSVGEALLFNLLSTCPQASAKMYHVTHIPRLLRSFLDWLATHHPVLATTVATELVDRPWEKALIFAMKACREFFRLDVDYVADLTTIVSTLFVKLSQEKVVATAGVQMRVDTGREGEAMVVLDVQELSHLSLDFLPAAERLRTAGLLVPVTSSGHLGRLTFCDPFVADHAISSMVSSLPAPDDKHLSFALGVGSHHIVLHLLAKDDTSPSQPLTLPSKLVSSADTSLSHPLSSPSDTTQLLLDCLSCYDTSHPAFELVAALSPEWPPPAHIAVSTCPALTPALKRKLRHLRLDDVDWETTETTLQAVVSATRHVDLSRKLSDATDVELRAVLACTQLTNVPGPLVLRPMLLSVAWQDRSPRRLASHPALKLCNNRLQERHVCCLETAMLGLESVAHFDLSDCEVSLTHLQRLLDAMPCHSVQELVLNGIRLTDDKEGQLPKFSHLGKLRHLMLERTGLRDKHLQHLGRQLQALPDLRELSLASNVITSTGLSHLVPALASRSTLRLLRLSECELDVGSAFVIGCILAAARDLHVINLNACHLQDDGLQHLVRVLHDKLRLTKVSLWQGVTLLKG